jgi:FG-GAP-like repeat/FG-GAP repeat
VNVFETSTSRLMVTLPIFEQSFTGGVRVVAADVNGDGVEDIIAAAGPGGGPRVRIIDGATFLNIADFNAFESTFTGGVFVSAGDFNRDGKADIVVSADRGGGPRVRIVDLQTNTTLLDFFGIADPDFRGGARTAVGDMNADGVPDLVVSAGEGGGPRIATYDGSRLVFDQRKLVSDFFAFDPKLRNGAFLAVGDLNGDGFGDLVLGSGDGGGPRVLALSGKALTSTGDTVAVADFFAGDPRTRAGVRVAIKHSGTANAAELYTADATGIGARVRAYSQASLATGTPSPSQEFDGFDQFMGGIFVG